MGRILLLVILGGLGAWAYTSAARGPSARPIADMTLRQPERVTFVPIRPYVPPPSNRTGSTRGPRVGGGGPSFGK
ncbi:MAG: hypothetical protein AAF170_04100 [Bacteroidota bacterium]